MIAYCTKTVIIIITKGMCQENTSKKHYPQRYRTRVLPAMFLRQDEKGFSQDYLVRCLGQYGIAPYRPGQTLTWIYHLCLPQISPPLSPDDHV